jgi:hypothetical protein
MIAACSTPRQEFIIVNNTDADLIVQYSYFDKARIIYKPRITSVDKFDDEGKKWREIPTQFFDVDGDSRVVRVKVEPNEALLINTAENYSGANSKDFPIDMINLSGSGENILYEKKEAQKAFKKQENGNYVIFYK